MSLIRIAALGCFCLSAIAASVAPAQETAGNSVVARLGANELHLSELRTLLERQDALERKRLLQSREQLERFVRTEIYRRAVLSEAKSKGWDRRADVLEQMDRAREQVLLAAYVNSVARAPADYPSDGEVRAFYESRRAELTAPRQFRIAQVYISAGERTDVGDVRKRKAEDIATRARATSADFAALARAESEHKPSADQGGELGWLAEEEMVPEVRAAVGAANKGDVIGPIRGAQGWHVLKLLDVSPAHVRTLAEVREELVALMRLRKAQENEQRYLDELAARQTLTVDQAALARLSTPSDSPPKDP